MRKTLPCVFRLGLTILAIFVGAANLVAVTAIDYSVSLARRDEQLLSVTMKVSGISEDTLELALPTWNNLYQIRDFVQFLERISATDERGVELPLERTGKSTWRLRASGAAVLNVRYEIRAPLSGSFSAELNHEHAFLHAALYCLFLPEFRSVPHTIHFRDQPASWRAATGLERQGTTYLARDYDELVDSPIELSEFEIESFDWQGVQYQVVVHGREESFLMADLVGMLQDIVAYQVKLMGEPPFRRFVFLYHISENGSGGMEHRNSTAIGLRRASLEQRIESAASVSAHEFFHLWNVKRIRPSEFDQMNWLQETPTRALWLSEGGTSYYSLLTLVRSGLIDEGKFYEQLSRQIQTLQKRPARLVQSVEQSSLETWFDRYPDYRRPESSISYYNKGMLLALLLDLEIRQRTNNQRSLDDVMRLMNVWFGARNIGFKRGDIKRAVESVSQSNFDDFFRRYVAGVEELPYARILAYGGMELVEEKAGAMTVQARNGSTERQRGIRRALMKGDPQSPR